MKEYRQKKSNKEKQKINKYMKEYRQVNKSNEQKQKTNNYLKNVDKKI